MANINKEPKRLSRRDFLKVGGLGFVELSLLLQACSGINAGPIIDVIPPASAAAFTPTPEKPFDPTAMFTASPTETAKAPSLAELGITDPAMIEKFHGVETSIAHETDGSYSVMGTSYVDKAEDAGFEIDQSKYTIDTTSFSINENLNNAYAPATVEAKDSENKPVTLIWNENLGWVKEFSLSTNVDNPTDFPYEARVPMLQSILLQHEDPFTERTNELVIAYILTENGLVTYLRTDGLSGNHSKPTDYWLRANMPDGQLFYINPTDINDLDGRIIAMCSYGKEVTTNLFNGELLDNIIHAQDRERSLIFWPILKADPSYLEKINIPDIGVKDESDLNYLLTLNGNKPEELEVLGNIINRDDFHLTNPGDGLATPLGIYGTSIDPKFQEMMIPCDIK
jgi:hypothetical protein